MIVKVLNITKQLPKGVLPIPILKHCNQYKDEGVKHASKFAWLTLNKYIDLKKVKFNPNGKPYLVGNKKYFSLSHSFDKVAIAIDSKPIGIDIETILPLQIVNMLAKRLLNKQQLTQFFKAKDRSVWFTKYWTMYEAYAKKLGKKLTFDFFKHKIDAKVRTEAIKQPNRNFIFSIVFEK